MIIVSQEIQNPAYRSLRFFLFNKSALGIGLATVRRPSLASSLSYSLALSVRGPHRSYSRSTNPKSGFSNLNGDFKRSIPRSELRKFFDAVILRRFGPSQIMLKENWKTISRFERLGDNLILVAAFFLAYVLRDPVMGWLRSGMEQLKPLAPIQNYYLILGISLPAFNAFLSLLGAYRSMRFRSAFDLLRISIVASVLVFLTVGASLFALKLDLSRSFVAIYCVASALLLLLERFAVLHLLRSIRARGKNFRNMMIVGTGEQARRIACEIVTHPELGVRIPGFVQLSSAPIAATRVSGNLQIAPLAASVLPGPVLGDERSFEAALKLYAIDEVLFTDLSGSLELIEDLAQIAVEEGVGVTLAADLFSLELFQSDISYFGSTPLVHYQAQHTGQPAALFFKRLLDLIVSAVLIVVLSPLMVLAALGVKLGSRGPIFFRQERVGLNGRRFTVLKFRSMHAGAERLRDKLERKNEMQGPVFKMKNDPRVTKFGKFLRRYSIDELPQLWNVFKGDMSLVGPRPPVPEEVAQYERKQRRRLSMRPGLTCTWQVSGRNQIPDFVEWAKMDLDYIDNWSFWRDLVLLVKTVPAVLRGTGL